MQQLTQVSVLRELGFELQRARKHYVNRDHVPVQARLKYVNYIQRDEPNPFCDHATLRRALHAEALKEPFLAEVDILTYMEQVRQSWLS